MLARRTPLFSVGLALALGCLVGLDGWVPLRAALVAFAVALLGWRLAARHEKTSLAAFYLLVACAGTAHTLFLASTIDPDDLRRLPDEKTFPTTQWRGVVVAEPVAERSTHTAHRALDRTSFVFRVEAWRPTEGRYFNAPVDTPWRPAHGDVQCILVGPADELRLGDELEAAAGLTPIPPPLCPGALDDRAYLAEQGIYYETTFASDGWRRLQTGGGDFWENLSFRARDWAYARLQLGLEDDPRTADFLAGMLIGYREEIPADIEQDFRRTGTLHVFAVSGQNVAEVVVVAVVLLQLSGMVRWRWAWTLAPVVLLYCLLTGAPASAVRATVMALAVLFAMRLGRPLNALGCWSIALIAMLCWNPAVLLDPGAQLSFGVVLGLILLAPPLIRLLQRPWVHDPFLPFQLLTAAQKREEAFWKYGAALVGATIAATLVSEPITAVDFHQVTPISVLANLVVVPTAGLITVVGTLAVAFSLVTKTWAALLNNANWLFARGLIAFVGFLAREPGASINVPDLRTLASPPPSLLVAPVQDSACLLVRTSSGAWLFNTGREAATRATTSHLLQFYGINRLTGLVLAQVSVADNSGAAIIVRDFHPEYLVVPALPTRSPLQKTLPGLATLAGRPFESWQRGRPLQFAPGLDLDVLGPSAAATSGHTEDRGLVLLFHGGGQTLLWAGKIDPAAQRELLQEYPGLRADILVLGPDSSPSDEWLQALGVRDWLQIPRRDRWLNASRGSEDGAMCRVWPLDETGAVDLHFVAATNDAPGAVVLRPWLALPSR
jgi:competence protein ComEC